MQQNLPLHYPALIKRFMQQGDDGYQDTFVFEGDEYLIEPQGDDFEIMRVTNTVTCDVHNFTEYDYSITYEHMPKVRGMLRWIESQINYTVTDWIEHLTKDFPIYEGQLLTIYNDRQHNHVVVEVHTGKDNVFYIKDDESPKARGALNFMYKDEDDIRGVLVTSDEPGEDASYINKISEQCDDLLLALFNSEVSLSHINSTHVRYDNAEVIREEVWSMPGQVVCCGQAVTIDSERKTIDWSTDEHTYSINDEGMWSKTKINKRVNKVPPPTDSSAINVMYHSNYIYITIKEANEHGFALGIVTLLNTLAAGEGTVMV